MTYFFMFDIDETILSTCDDIGVNLNDVPYELSHFNPYTLRGMSQICITLNKKKMDGIFKEILQNGHVIGFITAGGLEKSDMKSFFQSEYDIHLENFMHYNFIKDKTFILKKIANKHLLPYDNIFLIDNSVRNIYQASRAGFNAIYVDNNHSDITHGTTYIKMLESIISGFSVKEENEINMQKEEKKSVISENHPDPSPLIDFSKEALNDVFSENHDSLCPEVKNEISEKNGDPDALCKKSTLSRIFSFFSADTKNTAPFHPTPDIAGPWKPGKQ